MFVIIEKLISIKPSLKHFIKLAAPVWVVWLINKLVAEKKAGIYYLTLSSIFYF